MLGDSVALPCLLPSAGPCSERHWNMSNGRGSSMEVARAGVVTAACSPALRLGADCSLHIDRLKQDSAQTYVCGDGRSSASLSLEILQSKRLDLLSNSHRDLK